MFVTAIKNVNRRQEKASAASLCPGYIPIGQSVEVLAITGGDEIDGNSLWYRSVAGEFLWSGGFAPTEELMQVDGKPVAVSGDIMINVYESALRELACWFLSEITGCKGLALGHKNNDPEGALCLVALVDAKMDDAKSPVPATVNYRGVALLTDVRATGEIRSAGVRNDVYSDEMTPFSVGGGTLGEDEDPENSYGTRTALVLSGGKPYILTCYHVACHSLMTGKTLEFVSGDAINVNIPAKFAQSPVSKSGQVAEGFLGGQYDYALVSADLAWINKNMVEMGAFTGFYQLSELSFELLKELPVKQFGARTHEVKTGVVKNYKTDSVNINYKGLGELGISGLIITTVISQEGDSGAPVVDNSGKLLGQVVACDDNFTYIMPFAYLNHFKSITLIQ